MIKVRRGERYLDAYTKYRIWLQGDMCSPYCLKISSPPIFNRTVNHLGKPRANVYFPRWRYSTMLINWIQFCTNVFWGNFTKKNLLLVEGIYLSLGYCYNVLKVLVCLEDSKQKHTHQLESMRHSNIHFANIRKLCWCQVSRSQTTICQTNIFVM